MTVRYRGGLQCSLPAAKAFEYLSDLANARDWDPAVVAVRQVAASGVREGTEFSVRAALVGREQELAYRVVEHDPPHAITFLAETPRVTSRVRLSFEVHAAGTGVTYSTELTPRDSLWASELVLRLAVRQAGERALAGLRRALGPAVPQMLVPLSGHTLSGLPREFPRDLEHPLNLLVVGFRPEHRRVVDGWTPWLSELRRVGVRHLGLYRVAVLSSRYEPVRRSINESMARALEDPAARARTVTVYTDVEHVLGRLGLHDAETTAVVLVERSGRVLARERGQFDEVKARRLLGGHARHSSLRRPAPHPAA
jgi:Polyketide cyclase / dehydrase and lipid transport